MLTPQHASLPTPSRQLLSFLFFSSSSPSVCLSLCLSIFSDNLPPSARRSTGNETCMEAAQGYAPQELAPQNSPPFHHLCRGFLSLLIFFTFVVASQGFLVHRGSHSCIECCIVKFMEILLSFVLTVKEYGILVEL